MLILKEMIVPEGKMYSDKMYSIVGYESTKESYDHLVGQFVEQKEVERFRQEGIPFRILGLLVD